MPTTFDDKFGGVLEGLAVLLSKSATFRTWTGSATEAAALDHVGFYQDAETGIDRPFAIVWFHSAGMEAKAVTGGVPQFGPWIDGVIGLRFEAEDTAPTSPREGVKAYMAQVFGVVEDMETNHGTYDGALLFRAMRPIPGYKGALMPVRFRADEGHTVARFVWDWGVWVGNGGAAE